MKFLFYILLISICHHSFAKEMLEVKNAFVRFLPPTSKVSAAFMDIRNISNKDIAIIKAQAQIAKYVEIHNHVSVNGVMKMTEMPKLIIPKGKTVRLTTGSYHIMFIELFHPLKLDDKIDLKLVLEDKSEMNLKLNVLDQAPIH